MAAIPWPFACPRSWAEQSKPNLIRSNIEEGYPKVRRRFTKAWAEIQVTFVLSWTEKAALDQFLSKDCQDGAQPFTIVDPFTNQTRLVRWKDLPDISASADTKPTMNVSGTLEVVFS